MKTALPAEYLVKKFPWIVEEELIEEIMNTGKFHTCKSEEILFRPGDIITFIPLVIFGRIRLFREDPAGKEIFLYSIHPGETCAFSLGCFLQNIQGEIRAEAEEDTEMVMIPVHIIEDWMVRFRSFRIFIMQTFHNRFSELLRVINMIAFGQLDQRLVHFLSETAISKHSRVIRITHQEIAESLGSSREVITRLLKQLELAGKVRTGRNQIELLPALFEKEL